MQHDYVQTNQYIDRIGKFEFYLRPDAAVCERDCRDYQPKLQCEARSAAVITSNVEH